MKQTKITLLGTKNIPVELPEEIYQKLHDHNSEIRFEVIASPDGFNIKLSQGGEDDIIIPKLKIVSITNISTNG